MYGRQQQMSKKRTIDDAEIRVTGIEALNRALGSAAALRFLALLHRDPTDYVEISRRLYEGQSVDEVFERARKRWPEPTKGTEESGG